MTSLCPKSSLLWITVPALVLAVMGWFDIAAAHRVKAVSGQFGDSLVLQPDATSSTGFAGERRQQIVPGHNLESFEWIMQAQHIRHTGVWRERQVSYDNAPIGRTVQSPSAVRWWLAGVAQFGNGVNRAALMADPLLHVGLVLIITVIIMLQWGAFPAAIAALMLGLAYPMIGGFHPGAPSAKGMATVWSTVAIVGFLTGLRAALNRRSARNWWIMAAVAAGLALWVSPHRGYPVIVALALAGLAAGWLHRRISRNPGNLNLPWLSWAGTGAITTLVLWGLDFAGADIAWPQIPVQQIHPLYAVSWFGLGWVAALVHRARWSRPAIGQAIAATLLAASLVGTMIMTRQSGFLAAGLGADLITHLPDAVSAANFVEWVNEHSSASAAAAVLLPMGLVFLALWHLLRGTLPATERALLLAALIPTIGAWAWAFSNLAWWGTVFGGLAVIGGLIGGSFTTSRARAGFTLALLAVVGLGWIDLAPRIKEAHHPRLGDWDKRSLAERDLAHWLSLRQDEFQSVVLSPPDVTPALYFYGGVRGLGSPYPENGDGFIAAVRIASASSPDESLALATQRELSHIVIPAWDDFLDEYARLGAAQPEHSMMAMLHNWLAPRWMRPVYHTLPSDEALEGYSSVIFAVTETQDNATALARLGEYFAETRKPELATAVAVTLQQSFPADLGGLVAQAHIAVTQGNMAIFDEALAAIVPYVEEERDGNLEFDRRVSLANVLMLGREAEYAREQVGHCMDEMDEFLLKTVSAANLYRFLLLAESFHEPFSEDALADLARILLPADLRAQL